MLAANLQILGKGAGAEAYYLWIDKDTAGSVEYTDGTRGCWVEDTEEMLPPNPPIMLVEGAGVQIDCPAKKLIMGAGEVADDDIVFISRKEDGFNYVGNAYPGQLNIQDILLDDSVEMLAANLQILGKGAGAEAYYLWIDKDTAGSVEYTDGTRGCWVEDTEEMLPPNPPIILNPGAAVQIDSPANTTITVLAPIDL